MIRATVFVGVSLDGQIARADGSIDWLEPDPDPDFGTTSSGVDTGYNEFFASVDALVMGRATYETVLGFDIDWPYGDKPILVLSSTLTESEIPSVSFHPTVDDALAAAADRGFEHLYVDGGKTVQSFLGRGLVTDLVVTSLPILIGRGIPLFGDLDADIKLELVSVGELGNGMVQSRYRVIGTAEPRS